MTRKTPPSKQKSVFAEAWQNMSDDMDRFLPAKLRGGKGKGRLALWLALAELLVLAVAGFFVYDWLRG